MQTIAVLFYYYRIIIIIIIMVNQVHMNVLVLIGQIG